MSRTPWDQRAARVLVRPLIRTPVTPNHVTTLTLIIALGGAALLATGDPMHANIGAGLFVVARFLDHFDGELARQKGLSSKLGYYFDYVVGGVSYGALFACMGIGMRDGALGSWSIALGLGGTAAAVISMFTNLGIDKAREAAGETEHEGDAVGYPGYAGFELEDGIYLIAPITWLGWLEPFFVAAGVGAVIYCLWTCGSLLAHRRKAAQ